MMYSYNFFFKIRSGMEFEGGGGREHLKVWHALENFSVAAYSWFGIDTGFIQDKIQSKFKKRGSKPRRNRRGGVPTNIPIQMYLSSQKNVPGSYPKTTPFEPPQCFIDNNICNILILLYQHDNLWINPSFDFMSKNI